MSLWVVKKFNNKIIACNKFVFFTLNYAETGMSKILQTVAEKYEKCPDCSMNFDPEAFARKVIKENFVAVLVSDITGLRLLFLIYAIYKFVLAIATYGHRIDHQKIFP